MSDIKDFRINVFKLDGEAIVYVKASSIEDAQREAILQAKDLTFSPSRAPFMAIWFEGLEEVGTNQEEVKDEV